MKRVDVPDVVLVSQAQAQHAEQLKEAEAGVKKASEKIRQRGPRRRDRPPPGACWQKNPTDVNALFYLGLGHAGKQR